MAVPYYNANEMEQIVNNFIGSIYLASRDVRLEVVKAIVNSCRLDEMRAIKGFASRATRRLNQGQILQALPVFVLPPNAEIDFLEDVNNEDGLDGDPAQGLGAVEEVLQADGDGEEAIPDVGVDGPQHQELGAVEEVHEAHGDREEEILDVSNDGQHHEHEVEENDDWWFEGLLDTDEGNEDLEDEMVPVALPAVPVNTDHAEVAIINEENSMWDYIWHLVIAVMIFLRIQKNGAHQK